MRMNAEADRQGEGTIITAVEIEPVEEEEEAGG